jgi:hypothetical protein
MGTVRVFRWAAALLLIAFTGCEQAGPSAPGGAGAPQGPGAARCVGQAVEAYDANDSTSCILQGSDWDGVNHQCNGTVFTVHCSRADESGLPVEAAKSMCLDTPGCGWTESDGTVTHPSGRCEGTKIPCATLDHATCEHQPGCIDYSSGCENLNSFTWLNNVDCPYLQIADDVSYSVVRSACERAMGCKWVP